VCDMKDVREMAIKEIANTIMDSVDKILLGQAYGVPDWLFAGYKELVQRDECISRGEGQRLWGNTVAGLCQVREAAREAALAKRGVRVKHYNYDGHIRRKFKRELENANAKETFALRGTKRLYIGGSPQASPRSPTVRSQRYYMESIIFLVRCSGKSSPMDSLDLLHLHFRIG
jgi:hypothetical protein